MIATVQIGLASPKFDRHGRPYYPPEGVPFVNNGTAEVECAHSRAGLGITRAVWPDDGWTVTHLASGLTVAPSLGTRVRAMRALLKVLPLADWTQPASVLKAEAGLGERVKAARAEFYQ